MKSFIAKRVISIFVNFRYLRFKLLKYKENKKICNTFDHNFKNIPLYIMSNVSLERYYFVLYDGALTLKMSKMALNAFCDKTLHVHVRRTCINSNIDCNIVAVIQIKNIWCLNGRKLDTKVHCFVAINMYAIFNIHVVKVSLIRI